MRAAASGGGTERKTDTVSGFLLGPRETKENLEGVGRSRILQDVSCNCGYRQSSSEVHRPYWSPLHVQLPSVNKLTDSYYRSFVSMNIMMKMMVMVMMMMIIIIRIITIIIMESTKSRKYKKQPYWTLHTYCGKCSCKSTEHI